MEQDDADEEVGPVELTATEKARWQVLGSAIDALSESLLDGTLEPDAVQASLAQAGQIDLDLPRVRDALPVRLDAGKYATDARS